MPSYSQLVMPRGKQERARLMRTVRAAYRDSVALWREFRIPFIVFNLAVWGGGFLYGELLVLAGYERLPFIDLPYVMLQLMVFEPPGVTPPEPYLVAFWYALPAIGLYVIGRGAVEFVRLFFDRSERRDAWEVAVASTYRNHIIVLGVGHLGQRVMRALVDMGFDVVVIDLKVDAELGRELNDLSVPAIIGDGRSTVTLEDAGLHHAQTLIVCTSNDHANLEVTMRARDMNPNIRIVVRMWDDQFAAQMQRFMGVEAVLSASDLAAPVFAGSAVGVEITQTLTIDDVDYSMIRLTVERQSFMDNSTIDVLQEDNDIDIVLHGHGGQMQVHPDGDIPVTAGDTLVIFAHHNKITGIVSRNRRGSNGSD